MDRTVFIRHAANQCIDGVPYKANSAQEATRDTYARHEYGDAVVTETIDLYKLLHQLVRMDGQRVAFLHNYRTYKLRG